MDLPRVLFVGSDQGKIIEIIENLGAKLYLDQDNIGYFILDIDNKYYKCQVLLCIPRVLSKEFSTEGCEGLIICENLQKASEYSRLEHWSSITESCDAEVRLLVCDTIFENSEKDKVLDWCTEKQFELVELVCSDPSELQDLELEHNTFGINRITEALHAHRWPNISLKGSSSNSTNVKNDINKVSEQIENITLNQSNLSDHLRMDSVSDALMGDEDTDFGELFGQIRAMKEHVMTLPTNERKNAAELLVMALWKAMMGNDLDESS